MNIKIFILLAFVCLACIVLQAEASDDFDVSSNQQLKSESKIFNDDVNIRVKRAGKGGGGGGRKGGGGGGGKGGGGGRKGGGGGGRKGGGGGKKG